MRLAVAATKYPTLASDSVATIPMAPRWRGTSRRGARVPGLGIRLHETDLPQTVTAAQRGLHPGRLVLRKTARKVSALSVDRYEHDAIANREDVAAHELLLKYISGNPIQIAE